MYGLQFRLREAEKPPPSLEPLCHICNFEVDRGGGRVGTLPPPATLGGS